MLEIREIKQEDRELFLDMVNEFYHSPAVLHTVPKENFKKTFDMLMKSSPYQKGYLFESNGTAAGYALLALTWSNEAGGNVVWIEEVMVLESFRGKGIFKTFFDFIKREYQDAARIRLEAEKENLRAQKLYASLGFEELPYLQMVLPIEKNKEV